MVQIEITKRAKEFGYVIWKSKQDEDMSRLLGKRTKIEVVFLNAKHGMKNIDWKYRRISVGQRWTRALPASMKVFVLQVSDSNKLEIQCR